MFAKTKVVGVCLAALCGAATAQSIDEISELNRQAAIAEVKGRIAAAKRAEGGSAPAAPASSGSPAGGPPGMTPGAPVMPGSAPAPAAPAWKPMVVKKARAQPPVLVAIYGVGTNLMVELSEAGFEGKYRQGDKTPGGWTISHVDKRLVTVTRPGSGTGKAAVKAETVALPFGAKTEVPKETVSVSREPTPGNFSMPPLPPSFSAAR